MIYHSQRATLELVATSHNEVALEQAFEREIYAQYASQPFLYSATRCCGSLSVGCRRSSVLEYLSRTSWPNGSCAELYQSQGFCLLMCFSPR